MLSPHELNARFAVDGVRFEAGQGGLVRAVVTAPGGQAEIYLHGAHITHFQPVGQKPVLFTSTQSHFEPERPIRGGVPVIFPWFGPREGDTEAPMHGLARLLEWDVETVEARGDALEVTFALALSEPPHPAWPDCALRFLVSVGAALQMSLTVENEGAEAVRFEEALHTYFAVGDARRIEIQGLADTRYVDKTENFAEKTQFETGITLTGETDRVYLDTTATCVIHDPVWNRRIFVAKDNSNATVVWNPWLEKAAALPDFGDDEWTGMVCVETCNVRDFTVHIAPGESHTMTAEISVEAL